MTICKSAKGSHVFRFRFGAGGRKAESSPCIEAEFLQQPTGSAAEHVRDGVLFRDVILRKPVEDIEGGNTEVVAVASFRASSRLLREAPARRRLSPKTKKVRSRDASFQAPGAFRVSWRTQPSCCVGGGKQKLRVPPLDCAYVARLTAVAKTRAANVDVLVPRFAAGGTLSRKRWRDTGGKAGGRAARARYERRARRVGAATSPDIVDSARWLPSRKTHHQTGKLTSTRLR